MKKILCFLIISYLTFNGVIFSAPTNSISITNPTDGAIVSASDESVRYNEITTKYGAHSHTDILTDFTENTITIGDGAAGNKNYAVDTDNAGNPALRFSTTTGSWQVSTLAGAFPGRLTVSAIVDLDQDTGILLRKSADEDIIRFLIEDRQVIVFGDGSNEEVATFTNFGPHHAITISQNAVLAADRFALLIYTNEIQDTESTAHIIIDNAATSKEALEITYDGDGNSILADGASLNNAGEWTNRSSIHAEKLGTTEVTDFSDYITKLKDLKLFSYQKKREVYGSKKDILAEEGEKLTKKEKKDKKDGKLILKGGKKYRIKGNKKYEIIGREYGNQKKKPGARTYVGYILDDNSTPDELISRKNLDDSIAGVSPADGVNFLLGLSKALLAEIEDLEARIETLESYH